jgi:hypothetical protein
MGQRDKLIAATFDTRSLSFNAEWVMTRRAIPLALVQAVMEHPEQRLADESRTGAGFTSRGYGSKMGKCICCESWWPKMNSRP